MVEVGGAEEEKGIALNRHCAPGWCADGMGAPATVAWNVAMQSGAVHRY